MIRAFNFYVIVHFFPSLTAEYFLLSGEGWGDPVGFSQNDESIQVVPVPATLYLLGSGTLVLQQTFDLLMKKQWSQHAFNIQ